MKAKEVAKIAGPKDNKPSRYINTLLKAADKRKKEYERRVERKVQVEREKEGDKFKDKEAFVTSAYKQKMQEMEEEEERERRENLMNEMMDVTKQKDLSGFYRHFLKQSVGEEKIPEFGDKFKVKLEPVSDDEAKKTNQVYDQKKRKDHSESEVKRENHSNKTKRRRHNESDEDDSDHHSYKSLKKNTERVSGAKILKDSKVPHVSSRKTAIYRKHEHSSEDEEKYNPSSSKSEADKLLDSSRKTAIYRKHEHSSEDEEKYNPSSSKSEADKLLAVNLDQDSDIVDSEEEVDSEINIPRVKHRSKNTSDRDSSHSDRGKDNVQKKKMAKNIRKRTNDDSDASDSSKENEENSLPSNKNSTNGKTENTVEDQQPKVKRNIFEKRTVGDVFAAAQARYFQRMAARNA
ncbi:nuclear speckle splicing regulatory protein 1 [Trichonephila clavipes]|nr:nuclear speckle splicing regulatory protein 1 [Trichonephila clavipes]